MPGNFGRNIVPYFLWMVVPLMSLRDRKRPKLQLRGNDTVPTVDVLLITGGEPVPMILSTIRGSCNIA